MARNGVTYDEISAAAQDVLSRGETPTIEKVRLELGGKGSNTTISKYLNEWRRNFKPSRDVIPPNSSYSQTVFNAAADDSRIQALVNQLQVQNSMQLAELDNIKGILNKVLENQLKIHERNIFLTSELVKEQTKLSQAQVEIKALRESIESCK